MSVKKAIYALVLAVMMILLAGAAGAITDTGYSYTIYALPGRTVQAIHRDYSHLIDPALTMDDFDVAYSVDSEHYSLDEQGRITADSNVLRGWRATGYAIYTRKTTGEQYRVKIDIEVCSPTSYHRLSHTSCVLATDQTLIANVQMNSEAAPVIFISPEDPEVLQVEVSPKESSRNSWNFKLIPKQPGKTNVIIEFYDQQRVTMPAEVVNPPSSLTLAQEIYTAYVNEPLDIGLDMVGGGYNTLTAKIRYGSTVFTQKSFFTEDLTTFTSPYTGPHYVEMTTHNGLTAKAVINVYDRDICAKLAAEGVINAGTTTEKVSAYNAAGKKINVPMKITQGSDIASFADGKLVTTGTGRIEVTAYNFDGTTCSASFDVVAKPTAFVFSETHVTLEIGETFELQVGFDQGDADYQMNMYYDVQEPPYRLYPVIKRGDNTFVAQAPGECSLNFTALDSSVQGHCKITVLGGDKEIHVEGPELFGVGHTAQLRVVDKTGKEYAATYQVADTIYERYLSITDGGVMTGLQSGNANIRITLADGRRLLYTQRVEKVPSWLYHDDMTVHENDTTTTIDFCGSDVGSIDSLDFTVEIEDESIATKTGTCFVFHKPGQTKVTLTAKYGGAQTTFLLTVLPADDTLYVENTIIHVPSDYQVKLPTVYDYYGNVVPVTWEITYQTAVGNPNVTAFSLVNGNQLKCVWPHAVCQLEGTAKNGATIRIDAHAFRLAKEISFRYDTYTVEVGESAQIDINIIQSAGDMTGELTWTIGDESIIAFSERYPGTGMPTVTGLNPGTTTLKAKMINGVYAVCTVNVVAPKLLPGDANNNGAVTLDDALAIFYASYGWAVINEKNADVNGDGVVDEQDALRIMQYAAGWNVTLQ